MAKITLDEALPGLKEFKSFHVRSDKDGWYLVPIKIRYCDLKGQYEFTAGEEYFLGDSKLLAMGKLKGYIETRVWKTHRGMNE